MIQYFFNQTSLSEVTAIKELLNSKKKKLELQDFNNPFEEYYQAEVVFDKIKRKALDNKNEKLANSTYVTKKYFHLFGSLASYFALLQKRNYRQSWDRLQDCLDEIYDVGQFVYINHRFELPFLKKLLKQYEKMYPFEIFVSPEFAITKSECSICGKPMNNLSCPHIRGNLYWGEMACEKVLEIKEINSAVLVSNPLDKRCLIELADDDRTENEKFLMLDKFCNKRIYRFQMFQIKHNKFFERDENVKKQKANELCLCGSGKKFKKCCRAKMLYEHHEYQIFLNDKCEFVYFNTEHKL